MEDGWNVLETYRWICSSFPLCINPTWLWVWLRPTRAQRVDRNSLCRSCLQERGLDRRLERSLIITPINWYYNHYIQQTLTKKKDAIPLNVILSKPFICTDDNLFEWSAMPYKLWNSTRNVETHKAIAISTLFSKVCMRDDINPWDWLPLVPIPLL